MSSFYLLDRDGTRLTLAATNGLDRFQIGRAVVPFGEGITGRVAATREPMVIPDVAADPRFLWVRGIDQRRFVASMLSVPLMWHDQVVGVLNVQTETHRDFTASDVDQLSAIADLLGGHRREGPPPARGRGAGRAAQGPRPGAQRADRARHPRAADAAGGRPRLHRPARRRARARGPLVARPGPSRAAGLVAPGHGRPDRAPRPPRRLDPRVRARGPGSAAGPPDDRHGPARRRAAGRPRPAARASPAPDHGLAPAARRWPTGAASARCSSTCSRTP